MMPTYRIPVEWLMMGYMEIEADNIEAAILRTDSQALPLGDAFYVDESFKIDYDYLSEQYPEEMKNTPYKKFMRVFK